MAIHRFQIQVPNPTGELARPVLELVAVDPVAIRTAGYDLPTGTLRVRSARMTTDVSSSTLVGCLSNIRDLFAEVARLVLGSRKAARVRPLRLTLAPRHTASVRISIDTDGTAGIAAMDLVDRRDGVVVGGVRLVAVDGPLPTHAESVPATNPCPMSGARTPYWVPAGSDRTTQRFLGPLPAGYPVDLVVWVTNATSDTLSDAFAYLEHLGGADVEFRPATWNLGEFEPGAMFPLRWRLTSRPDIRGSWEASVVVGANHFDPVRLRPRIDVAPPGRIEAVPLGVEDRVDDVV